MNRYLVLLLSGACYFAAAGASSGKGPRLPLPPAPDGERFLFVFENSSSMEDLQEANEATLFELIRSGVGGQMRAGDTYGLWTFNKVTQAGQFPMQVWDPKKSTQQGTIAAAFVNQRHYEKSPNIKEMMVHLTEVVKAVSNLTVFVITDGGSDMTGTPFDKAINADYRKQNRARKQAKRPFVTTLIVREGWFVEGYVTVGGSAIQLPARPVSQLASKSNPPPAAVARVAPVNPAIPAPPRSNIGAVTAMRELASTEPPSEPYPGPTPTVAAILSAHDAALQNRPDQASLPPAPASPPRKVMQIITKTNAPTLPPPAPVTTEQAIPVVAAASTSIAASVPPAIVSSNTSSIVPAPPAVPIPAAPVPSAPASAAQSVAAAPPPPPLRAPASDNSTAPGPVASGVSSVAPATGGFLEPAPLPVAARELADPTKNPTDPGLAAGNSGPASVAQALAAPVVAAQALSAHWLILFGGVLMILVLFLLILVLRRGRQGVHGSLITQSMDRR